MKSGSQKMFSILLGGLLLLGNISCKKSDNTNTSATMSATIAGNGTSFSTTLTSSNGETILQGSSSHYTLTLYLKISSPGIYTLADQSTGNYVTVTDNLSNITYSTDATNTGQATLTANGIKYNGSFYCTCNETAPSPGGGNAAVTNGSFTGM